MNGNNQHYRIDSVRIRKYREHDLVPCRGLWKELVEQHRLIYKDHTIGGNNPGIAFDKYLARIKRPNVYVAVLAGAAVALAGLKITGTEAEIDPIVVSKQYRMMGIGTKLVDRLTTVAKSKRVKYLSIKPVARNTDAIAFYYKLGYRKIGQIEMFVDLKPSKHQQWKDGIDLFHMKFQY